MRKRSNPLDNVSVAAPCNVGWDNMIGNDQVRFCGQCNLNVYNLSGMTKVAAERVIAGTEGRLCIRYYRRADGTILTKNCPVGLRALKRRVSRIATALASAILSFFAGIFAVTGLRESPLNRPNSRGSLIRAIENLRVWPKDEPKYTMGAIAPVDSKQWVEGRMERRNPLIEARPPRQR